MTKVEGMLLQWVDLSDEDEIEALVTNDAFCAEQKFDGARCLIRATKTGVEFLGRGGGALEMSACKVHYEKLALEIWRNMAADVTLDGELVHQENGRIWVWDVFDTERPLRQRQARLDDIFADWKGEWVTRTPVARTTAEKRALIAGVIAAGAEGVVFKDLDALYEPGVRVKHQLKAKVFKTADVVVTWRDRGGCNAGLSVYDAEGDLTEIGACSMIGKPDAQVNDVVEVRYLYATPPSMRMYGPPNLERLRPDKMPIECTIDQLVPVSRKVVV